MRSMIKMYWGCVVMVTICLSGCLSANDDYSYSEYPKHMRDKEACGRADTDKPIYVCDPNHLLKGEDDKAALALDVQIEGVMNETKCRCATNVCERSESPGYRIYIALVKKLKLPPVNEENTQTELQRAMGESGMFASKKLHEWRDNERCNDDVLIFYSLYDGVIYTVTGEVAGQKLGQYTIADILMIRKPELRRDIFRGLLHIVSDYKAVFLDQYKPMDRVQSKPKYEAVRAGAETVSSVLYTILLPLLVLLQY